MAYIHGHSPTINGKRIRSGTLNSWSLMRQRCLDPNNHKYPDYGGRGITICDRWNCFSNFLIDMGERPHGTSIDRIDNSGNYEPANCKWSSSIQQANNKRNTRMLTWNGLTKPSAEWARELNIPANRIRDRIHKGWSDERILSNPSPRINQYR